MVEIIISDTAYADLEDIEAYISQDSPAIARKFILTIFHKIDQLREYPLSGKPVYELNYKNIRELLLNRYRIIYRLNEDKIIVLRIVHGSRLIDLDS